MVYHRSIVVWETLFALTSKKSYSFDNNSYGINSALLSSWIFLGYNMVASYLINSSFFFGWAFWWIYFPILGTNSVSCIFLQVLLIDIQFLSWQIHVCGFAAMGLISMILFWEQSPPLYHAYIAMTIFLWTRIIGEHQFLKALWRYLCGEKLYYVLKLLATLAVSVMISEFLVRMQKYIR